jgi:hypothetical protein
MLDTLSLNVKYQIDINGNMSSVRIFPNFIIGLKYYVVGWYLCKHSIMNKLDKQEFKLDISSDKGSSDLSVNVSQNFTRIAIADWTNETLYIHDMDGALVKTIDMTIQFGMSLEGICVQNKFITDDYRVVLHCPEKQLVYIFSIEV